MQKHSAWPIYPSKAASTIEASLSLACALLAKPTQGQSLHHIISSRNAIHFLRKLNTVIYINQNVPP